MRSSEIPAELDFLRSAVHEASVPIWKRARFLKSPFGSDVWMCQFGDAELEIRFRVRLGGGFLTDPRNNRLLSTFKAWICVQDHPETGSGGNVAPTTMMRRVGVVLHLIDYFLVNAVALGVAEHGLGALTRSDAYAMFSRLAKHKDINEAVYRWTEKLTVYLRAAGSSLDKRAVESAVSECPGLEDELLEESERTTGLNNEELVRARAFLVLNGMTIRGRGKLGITLNSRRVSELLFANTLAGDRAKVSPPELAFGSVHQFDRELVISPCRDFSEKPRDEKSLSTYNLALSSLSLVPSSVLQADAAAIEAWPPGALGTIFAASAIGRTKTLPVPVMLKGLRTAIEFVLEYGSDIVDSFVSLTKAAHSVGKNCLSYANDRDITTYLSQSLRAINVSRWDEQRRSVKNRVPSAVHYRRVRSAPTLIELISVLVGASYVIVGTLMARRQGELSDLTAADALDESRRYLVFFNRKSGTMGLRERELRPIPSIAVTAIELLQRMHRELSLIGRASESASLFRIPLRSGEIRGTADHFLLYKAVDLFCDFFEIDLDDDGRRYYFRTHQLRRFFAMVFFWHAGYGQMDTIRWFLGHTDVAHLYRYILESTPGEAMHNIRANYAVERMAEGDEEASALAEVIQRRFGVKNVSLLDHDELAGYVTALLREGTAKIDPIFFSNSDGQSFRVAIKVLHGGA